MPTASKPRKAYRPKPVVKPLGVKLPHLIETPARMAMVALGTDWIGMPQINDIGAHGWLVMRLADKAGDAKMEARGKALVHITMAIQARHERTARIGTTGDEMQTLRSTLDITMPWLMAQSNQAIYTECKALLKTLDRQQRIAG